MLGTIHKNVREVIELLSMLPKDLPVGGEDWDEGIGIELYYDQAKNLSSLQFMDLNNVAQDDEDWQTWRRCCRPNQGIEPTPQSVASSTEVAQDESPCQPGGAAHLRR